MREIKFRAWIKENVFEYQNEPYMENDVMSLLNPFEEHRDGNIILMQHTGLKDKNGVEIYEGDIVREYKGGIQFNFEDYETRIVEWSDFGWSPFVNDIGSKSHDYAGNLFEYIVVGNIYEKPKLINQ